jgi:hypothetical protein
MTKILVLSMLAVLAAPLCVKAEPMLAPGPSSKTINSVPIYDAATARISDQSFALTGKASALRAKVPMFQPIPKYVVQMLVPDGAAYDASSVCTNGVPNADNALKALESQKLVVVRLDFVANISDGESGTTFSDSFAANGVDETAPAIKQFLGLVSVDVTLKDSWTIAIERNVDGNDVLAFENANGVVSKLFEANLMRRIMSVWIGEPPFAHSESNFLKSFLCG